MRCEFNFNVQYVKCKIFLKDIETKMKKHTTINTYNESISNDTTTVKTYFYILVVCL